MLEGTVLFVNKKNQKNFRRMLRILKLPAAQISVYSLGCSFPAQRANNGHNTLSALAEKTQPDRLAKTADCGA